MRFNINKYLANIFCNFQHYHFNKVSYENCIKLEINLPKEKCKRKECYPEF